MGGALFSGLVGGFSQTAIDQKKQKQAEADRKREAEIQVLQQAAGTGQLSEDQLAATFSRMEEIVGAYGTAEKGGSGGKGKAGGFKLSNLLGRGGQNSGSGNTKNGGAGQTTGATQGSQQQTPASGVVSNQPPTRAQVNPAEAPAQAGAQPQPGAQPAAPPPAAPAGGGPPTRQALFGPGSFQPKPDKIQQLKQELQMKAQLADDADKARAKDAATMYKKLHPDATDEDVMRKAVVPILYPELAKQDAEQQKAEDQKLRDDNRDKFQLQMEQTRQKFQTWKEDNHERVLLEMFGKKLSAEQEKTLGVTPKERASQYNDMIRDYRTQVGEANKRFDAATKQNQTIDGSLMKKMFSDRPDLAAAKKEIDQHQAALSFLELNRDAVVAGKVDPDAIFDQAQTIAMGGTSAVPATANVTATIDMSQPAPKKKGS